MADPVAATFTLGRSNSYFARVVTMTWRGNWTSTPSFAAGFGGSALVPYASGLGPPVEFAATEFSGVLQRRALLRYYTEPLTAQTVQGTATLVLGVRESLATANAFLKVYGYLTVGDTDAVRAVVIDFEDTLQEFPTTATFQSYLLTITSQAAQDGDRLCLELGFYNNTAGSATAGITVGAVNFPASAALPAGVAGNTNTSAAAPTITFSNPLTLRGAALVAGDLVAGNGDVVAYRADGTLRRVFYVRGGLGSAVGAQALNGDLLVTNEAIEVVQRLDLDLEWLTEYAVPAPQVDPHFVTVAADGTFYVGHNGNALSGPCINEGDPPASGNTSDLVHFDNAGAVLGTVPAAVEGSGTPSGDLAADQTTLFYGSIGRTVFRVNVLTGTQLANFVTLAGTVPTNTVRGMKVLPDGGLLVADAAVIQRLDAGGVVTQTYSEASQADWGTLALDPTGTNYVWAANTGANVGGGVPAMMKFDLTTGALLQTILTPISSDLTGVNASQLCSGGIVVIGGFRAGTSTPIPPVDEGCPLPLPPDSGGGAGCSQLMGLPPDSGGGSAQIGY